MEIEEILNTKIVEIIETLNLKIKGKIFIDDSYAIGYKELTIVNIKANFWFKTEIRNDEIMLRNTCEIANDILKDYEAEIKILFFH